VTAVSFVAPGGAVGVVRPVVADGPVAAVGPVTAVGPVAAMSPVDVAGRAETVAAECPGGLRRVLVQSGSGSVAEGRTVSPGRLVTAALGPRTFGTRGMSARVGTGVGVLDMFQHQGMRRGEPGL
jgi:hypothetical protein